MSAILLKLFKSAERASYFPQSRSLYITRLSRMILNQYSIDLVFNLKKKYWMNLIVIKKKVCHLFYCDWCLSWSSGNTQTELSIFCDVWNPSRERSFVPYLQCYSLRRPPQTVEGYREIPIRRTHINTYELRQTTVTLYLRDGRQ